MFSFDRIARIASAAICSLVLTTVAVGAAIGPVGTGGGGAQAFASAPVQAESARG